ncbi:unnamed protein product, partial [Phaeothamnion confervicola]
KALSGGSGGRVGGHGRSGGGSGSGRDGRDGGGTPSRLDTLGELPMKAVEAISGLPELPLENVLPLLRAALPETKAAIGPGPRRCWQMCMMVASCAAQPPGGDDG